MGEKYLLRRTMSTKEMKSFKKIPKLMHKLVIVVPYRDREEHLSVFLSHMEKFLGDAGVNYSVVVVEQEQGKPFNRGKLLNIGFDLSKNGHDYFVFHDVDMIPSEADYSWVNYPTHMATNCSQFEEVLPYYFYFGGVTMFNKKDFISVNGYSNEYWGWGSEDDDMFFRCLKTGKEMRRRNGVYKSLIHDKVIDKKEHLKNVVKLRAFMSDSVKKGSGFLTEGLNSLKYTLKETKDMQSNAKKYRVMV
jgi:hypothetical protein